MKAQLTASLNAQVAAIETQVESGSYSHVLINGYTNPGTHTAQQNALGLARATNVKNYLTHLFTANHVVGVSITVASQGGTNLYGPIGTANRLVVAQIS